MSNNNKKEREIVVKVVVCGDGAVGKTCILAVYQKGQFPEKYIPTWVPEINKETGGNCKFIICGTKKDLREDQKTIDSLSAKGLKPVSTEEGEAFAKSIGAKHYVECSAKENDGVKQVFDKAFKTGIFDKSPNTSGSSKGGCQIL
eukprot:gene2796-4204_t